MYILIDNVHWSVAYTLFAGIYIYIYIYRVYIYIVYDVYI